MLVALAALILLSQGYFVASLLLRDPQGPQAQAGEQISSQLPIPSGEAVAENTQLGSDPPAETGAPVLPSQPAKRTLRWLRWALAPGLGMGLVSLVFFFWRAILGTPNVSFVLFEIAITLVLAALYLRAGLRPFLHIAKSQSSGLSSVWRIILPVAFILGILGVLITYYMGRTLYPQGTIDAWMIWNLAARYLSIGGGYWKNLFSSNFFHADYPLLLGANIARLWAYIGQQAEWVPQLFSIAFAVCLIGLVTSGVGVMRGRLVGMLAGLGLIAAATLGILSAAQTADIPLAYFYLASLILIYLVEVGYTKDYRRTMVLAGICAGLAAWTKNEGWLFLVALLAVKLLPIWRSPERQHKLAPWGWFGLGSLPILGLVLIFKFNFAPPNALIAGQTLNTLAQVLYPSRYLEVAVHFLQQFSFQAAKSGTPYLILGLFLLAAGIAPGAMRRTENRSLLYLLLLMLGGYILTYIISPLDLEFLLRTSIFRLFLQLWPITVFLVMMIANLPGIASTWQVWYPPPQPAALTDPDPEEQITPT
jgi:hypothetical protein